MAISGGCFRVVLAEGCPAYLPFLDFFLNMDSINDSEMNCVVSSEGWVFYGNNATNTICTNFYCPRASFSSFEYGADRSAPGAPEAPEAPGTPGAAETHLTFRTIRDAMHLYRAILARSEISEVCITYCWGDDLAAAADNSDFVTIAARRKVVGSSSSSNGKQQQQQQQQQAEENDTNRLFLSADIVLGALSETVQFVDVEKLVDLNQFTFRVTLPSASLENSMKLARKCFGDSVFSIAVDPHPRTPSISFHASDQVIMRNCTIPLSMGDVREHTLSAPGLKRCRFFLHWRPCAVIQQFCRIASSVSLFMHNDAQYPGFVKFASDTGPQAPFMYVVYAWHSEPEDDNTNSDGDGDGDGDSVSVSNNTKKRAREAC